MCNWVLLCDGLCVVNLSLCVMCNWALLCDGLCVVNLSLCVTCNWALLCDDLCVVNLSLCVMCNWALLCDGLCVVNLSLCVMLLINQAIFLVSFYHATLLLAHYIHLVNYVVRLHQEEDDLLQDEALKLGEHSKCPCKSLSWALKTVTYWQLSLRWCTHEDHYDYCSFVCVCLSVLLLTNE